MGPMECSVCCPGGAPLSLSTQPQRAAGNISDANNSKESHIRKKGLSGAQRRPSTPAHTHAQTQSPPSPRWARQRAPPPFWCLSGRAPNITKVTEHRSASRRPRQSPRNPSLVPAGWQGHRGRARAGRLHVVTSALSGTRSWYLLARRHVPTAEPRDLVERKKGGAILPPLDRFIIVARFDHFRTLTDLLFSQVLTIFGR